MSETWKHTPGPIRRHQIERATIVAGTPGGEIANYCNGFGDQQANAHYKMLAALIEARESLASLDHMNSFDSGLAVIRAGKTIGDIIDSAISKATGTP